MILTLFAKTFEGLTEDRQQLGEIKESDVKDHTWICFMLNLPVSVIMITKQLNHKFAIDFLVVFHFKCFLFKINKAFKCGFENNILMYFLSMRILLTWLCWITWCTIVAEYIYILYLNLTELIYHKFYYK